MKNYKMQDFVAGVGLVAFIYMPIRFSEKNTVCFILAYIGMAVFSGYFISALKGKPTVPEAAAEVKK